jgi:hypothetical protein
MKNEFEMSLLKNLRTKTVTACVDLALSATTEMINNENWRPVFIVN